eukprot:gnl/MRDRNA2_/MRDRNA2_364025_c0_seq1.p1 gnl/MRDRNA2_/MRDRNA2_364025_c0~~gnl/MRDRNA2_/MRDRNA2_364025_c0_seq1.p1  ORF type:complete len:128 (+),score=14.55 gnl/MRDRNA2_/MRDRNA2_364025_c0_seq1:40-384(+)
MEASLERRKYTDQVRLFHEARLIAGVDGAAMVHLAYARSGAAAVNFVPAARNYARMPVATCGMGYIWHTASMVEGLSYWSMQLVRSLKTDRWITIPVDSFRKLLRALLRYEAWV